ncbi:MAG: hypothetical protein DRP90_00135 [Planctomycetota bacterium]|nr:MAG: hypothetical protein DRP90_00135 [Planctomycetota bacterium]
MIEINLLPQRYRQVESTPLKIGVAVIVGIVLVLSSLFFVISYHIKTNNIQTEVSGIETELASWSRRVKELEHVELEWKVQQQRKDTVRKLFLSRVLLAPKLARLQQLVPSNIQIEAVSFQTKMKRSSSRGRRGTTSIVRSLTLQGVARAPLGQKDPFYADDVRMNTITGFTAALEADPIFSAGMKGDVSLVKSINKENREDLFFYLGDEEPYKKAEVPVYTFAVQASYVFEQEEESSKKKKKK